MLGPRLTRRWVLGRLENTLILLLLLLLLLIIIIIIITIIITIIIIIIIIIMADSIYFSVYHYNTSTSGF